MFSEFENMFKKQADKITKAMPLDLLDGYTTSLVLVKLSKGLFEDSAKV